MKTFEQTLQEAPMSLGQDEVNQLFSTIAEQSKTILLQKKQINYLVEALKQNLPSMTPANAPVEAQAPAEVQEAEAVGAELAETSNGSAN